MKWIKGTFQRQCILAWYRVINVPKDDLFDSSVSEFLKIFHGESNGSPIIGSYCGDKLPYTIFKKKDLFIHFRTDNIQYSSRSIGFQLEYSEFSKYHSPLII